MKKWKKLAAIGLLCGMGLMMTACEPKKSVEETAIEADLTQSENTEDAEELLTEEKDTEEVTMEAGTIYISVNGYELTAKLEENSSARALLEKLGEGDITVDMRDYANFEKVGPLGFDLPRNDESYTTKAGDIILYQGSQIVFYYDTNSWNFTKLGEFQNVTKAELMEIFGNGDMTAVISLEG